MEIIVEKLSSEKDAKSDFIVYGLLLSVVMFWGASWPFGSIISKNVPPLTAAFLRYTISLPFFFIAALFIEKDLRVPKKLHPKIFVLGVLQVTLYNIFFLTGLKFTGPSDAVLIIAMNPAITALIASQIYPDEKFTRNKALGLLVAMFGVVIVVSQSPNTDVPNRALGNFIIFLAALTWATFTALAKPVLKEVKPLTFTAWDSFYGWLVLLIISPFQGPWLIETEFKVWMSIVYLAIIAGVYGNIVYNSGVGKIGPSRTSIFVNLVPIFGVISSLILIPEEKFSFWYIVALVLILTGVGLVNKKPRNQGKSNLNLITPH